MNGTNGRADRYVSVTRDITAQRRGDLKRLPVDTLKIDRAFVHDLPHEPDDVAIARAIVAPGRRPNLSTVAAGVETVAQKSFLGAEGRDAFQGC